MVHRDRDHGPFADQLDRLDLSASLARKEYETRLEALQELLFAEGRHKLLIVLQAMDTGGKDGVIRSLIRHGETPAGIAKTLREALAG